MAKRKIAKRKIDERTTQRDDHCTPEWLIDRIYAFSPKGYIGLDPAGSDDEYVPASVHSDERYCLKDHTDGLSLTWRGFGLVFCNPEYGRTVVKWAKKAVAEFSPKPIARDAPGHQWTAQYGEDELFMLVAARVNSRWFRLLLRHAAAVMYFDKRLAFIGEDNCAKFPSALLYFGPNATRFAFAFGDLGNTIYCEGSYDPTANVRNVVLALSPEPVRTGTNAGRSKHRARVVVRKRGRRHSGHGPARVRRQAVTRRP